MNEDTLSVPTATPFILAGLRIVSKLSLLELAQVVSLALFNRELLGGLEDCIRDEVPTVYCEILGLQFVLSGKEPEYYLGCSPSLDGFDGSSPEVHITFILIELLRNANIEAIPLGPPANGMCIVAK